MLPAQVLITKLFVARIMCSQIICGEDHVFTAHVLPYLRLTQISSSLYEYSTIFIGCRFIFQGARVKSADKSPNDFSQKERSCCLALVLLSCFSQPGL